MSKYLANQKLWRIVKALYDNNTATHNLAALIRIQLGGKDE